MPWGQEPVTVGGDAWVGARDAWVRDRKAWLGGGMREWGPEHVGGGGTCIVVGSFKPCNRV